MNHAAATSLSKPTSAGLRAAAAAALAATLTACAGLSIDEPKDNDVLPSPVQVSLGTGTSFRSHSVAVDGQDVTAQVPQTSPSRAAGAVTLAPGLHTLNVNATLACSTCSGGQSTASGTRSFVVDNNTSSCVLATSVPVISLGADIVKVGRSPGRKQIGYQLKNGKSILLLVDDAPALLPTQMLIETDLDPQKGATASKRIEGWPRCHLGSTPTARVSATLAPNTNVATDCATLSAANDLRPGCTVTSQPVLIDQFRTRWLSINEEEYINASVWQAFGGRALRFIWITN